MVVLPLFVHHHPLRHHWPRDVALLESPGRRPTKSVTCSLLPVLVIFLAAAALDLLAMPLHGSFALYTLEWFVCHNAHGNVPSLGIPGTFLCRFGDPEACTSDHAMICWSSCCTATWNVVPVWFCLHNSLYPTMTFSDCILW